jgi:hypothetical protein
MASPVNNATSIAQMQLVLNQMRATAVAQQQMAATLTTSFASTIAH